MYQKYPKVGSVQIDDRFWTPYLHNIRSITLPYVFKKMEETNYISNLVSVATSDGKAHIDATLCVGCGVCKQLCAFDAIK